MTMKKKYASNIIYIAILLPQIAMAQFSLSRTMPHIPVEYIRIGIIKVINNNYNEAFNLELVGMYDINNDNKITEIDSIIRFPIRNIPGRSNPVPNSNIVFVPSPEGADFIEIRGKSSVVTAVDGRGVPMIEHFPVKWQGTYQFKMQNAILKPDVYVPPPEDTITVPQD